MNGLANEETGANLRASSAQHEAERQGRLVKIYDLHNAMDEPIRDLMQMSRLVSRYTFMAMDGADFLDAKTEQVSLHSETAVLIDWSVDQLAKMAEALRKQYDGE